MSTYASSTFMGALFGQLSVLAWKYTYIIIRKKYTYIISEKENGLHSLGYLIFDTSHKLTTAFWF